MAICYNNYDLVGVLNKTSCKCVEGFVNNTSSFDGLIYSFDLEFLSICGVVFLIVMIVLYLEMKKNKEKKLIS